MTWPANCWIIILPWNVLLFSLEQQMNGELTPSKRWAHSKQTMRAHWTEFGDRLWTVNGEQTQRANGAPTQVKCERWTHGERYVNSLWTQDDRFIRSASGVILTLYFIDNQEKKNRINYMYLSWKLAKQSYPILYLVSFILSANNIYPILSNAIYA